MDVVHVGNYRTKRALFYGKRTGIEMFCLSQILGNRIVVDVYLMDGWNKFGNNCEPGPRKLIHVLDTNSI